MKKIYTMEEAMDLIRDGDTIWVNAFAACASPVDLNKAITRRFRATGHPKHLTVYSAFSFAEDFGASTSTSGLSSAVV